MDFKSYNGLTTYDQITVNTNNLVQLIEQFIAYSRESRGHSESTVRTRQTHLKQFGEYCLRIGVSTIHEINHLVVDSHFIEYTKTHSKNTTNTGRRILKVFLRWLTEYKELDVTVHPEAIRLVRVHDRLPKSLDVSMIRGVIRRTTIEQDALVIAVMFESGIRIGELVNLMVFDFKGDSIHIRGKGEVDRMVYITDQLSRALNAFIYKNDPAVNDYLFQNIYHGYGSKLTIGTARLRIQRCFMKEADVQMHPHQLRHTFAINLLQSGCDIVTIQNLMGHKDVTTTQVYLRVSNDYIRNEYRKYMIPSSLP